MGIAAFLLKNVKIDGWLMFEIDRSRLVTLASFHHPAGSCQKVPADFHPHLEGGGGSLGRGEVIGLSIIWNILKLLDCSHHSHCQWLVPDHLVIIRIIIVTHAITIILIIFRSHNFVEFEYWRRLNQFHQIRCHIPV